jgi:hypothetical protein
MIPIDYLFKMKEMEKDGKGWCVLEKRWRKKG